MSKDQEGKNKPGMSMEASDDPLTTICQLYTQYFFLYSSKDQDVLLILVTVTKINSYTFF